MPALNCSVKNCYYNKEAKCCRDGIKVEGSTADTVNSTACGDFKEQSEGSYTSSCHCGMPPETSLNVQCEATKCTFNSDRTCSANHITIDGNGAKHYTETECGSFRTE